MRVGFISGVLKDNQKITQTANMTKNDERGKFGNRLAKSCFSEDNEDSDSSSNSDYSMEDMSSVNRMDGKEGKQKRTYIRFLKQFLIFQY